MSRRWISIAALLCPACATGSGPPPQDDTRTNAGSGATDDPPAASTPTSTRTPTQTQTPPPAGTPAPTAGTPAPTTPAPTTKPPAQGGGDPHLDCQALWAVVDHTSCAVVTLVCAVLESVPSAGAQVPCDVVVPLVCGLASTAASAAEAACPR